MLTTTKPECILLDVEGTTSSISFVYDVMFPYVRENLNPFLKQNWDSPAVQDCLATLAQDVGHSTAAEWLDSNQEIAQAEVASAVIKLMDDDIKATGLKQLQGLIWKSGFESGEMVAHLFDDVADSIRRWHSDGIAIRIYSSGSIAAQKLFFGHCIAGDLLPLIAGHYDTTIGHKKETESYNSIAADIGLPADKILFLSDVAEELDAAAAAGFQVALSIRPGNKPESASGNHPRIESFEAIQFDN